MSKNSRILLLAAVVAGVALSGCGKKRAVKEVFKPETQPKSIISTNEDYIYLISVGDSDPRSDSSRPHWQSYSKIVRMKFTEKTNSLDVFQVNRDKATNQNKISNKSVISIPIDHVDYRCKENAYKECTGSEEINDELNPEQKKYFIPNFEKTEIIERSFLPIAMDGIDEQCFSKKKQTVISGKIDKDAVNIELESTYETKPECMNTANVEGIEDFLEQMTFRVRYYISIVKAKTLVDPQYKEVIYPVAEQSTFGFFVTEESVMDVDNRNTETSRISKLDRWSPNKKKLVYYLNDEFEKPEFSDLKTLSFKAGEAVNKALKSAGSNIDFEVQSGRKDMIPENLRNSMIVLVPEPLDSGLLGYGPHAANPATGEILHASVVMYAGNMKQSIYRTWDEVVRAYIDSQKPKAPPAAEKVENGPVTAENSSQKLLNSLRPTFKSDIANILQPIQNAAMGSSRKGDNVKVKIPGINIEKTLKETLKYSNHSYVPKERLLGLDRKKESEIQSVNEALNHGSLMDYYSRNNYYHSDVFNFEGAILAAFEGKIPGNLLKPWSQLTASEKESVIHLTLPHVWAVTLIHEIGHTLGLRHNFAGSEDKDNFYTENELKHDHGISYQVPFSSVMEYPFTDIGALPVMGKYDVAALAYGYSRKLFTKTGKLVDMAEGGIAATEAKLADDFAKLPADKKTQEESSNFVLKEFGYCTDENVDVNPGCKRFDTGTNLPEIAQHLVSTYESFYQYRNKRNGRRNFSAANDGAYAMATAQNFRYMRMFFERYEDLAEKLPRVDQWADPEYVANPVVRQYLKELKDSVLLIGNHFMNILMEPDQTCVIHDLSSGQNIALPLFTWMDRRAAGLNNVNPNLFSCSELTINSKAGEMLAEIGKSFANKKSPDNNNKFADQIDIRGIWSDKLLAAYFLLARTIGIGTVDTYTANFMDVPELQGQLIVLLKALILDEVEREIDVPTAKGVVKVNTFTPMAISHVLRPSMSGLANRIFGIDGEFRFSKAILNTIKRRLPSVVNREVAEPILENFRIYAHLTEDEIKNGKFQTLVTSDGSRYYYKEENTLAKNINTRFGIMDNLQELTTESVEKILKALAELDKVENEKDKPAKVEEIKKSLDESEAKSFTFFSKMSNGQKAIQQALSGNLKPRSYYEEVLGSMVF